MTALEETTWLEGLPTHDFGHFLHALRTRRLSMMPSDGVSVVLSGGANNQIYFDWLAAAYPGRIERHIAVEYFSPPPDPLPARVEWLPRTLGDLAPVGDGEVDLVFAGQVIEHLWPDDMAGFLREANRVLRPDGHLVIDSPTRFITEGLAWTHPEHTMELEVDEIVELLELAGFVDIDVKGVWLCYDRERAELMRLDLLGGGDEWPWQRRVLEAELHPRDSFIWWAESRNGRHSGDAATVRRRVGDVYERVRPKYFKLERMRSEIGESAGDSLGARFRAPRGVQGVLLRGPGCAMPPGRHEAAFRLGAEAVESWLSPSRIIAEIAVTRDDGRVVADWPLTARELPPGGAERQLALPFSLRDTAFNCELSVRALGVAPLVASLPVGVQEGVQNGRKLTARSIGPDSAHVRARTALRSVQRILGWPARRLLDPRLEGLRSHAQWTADRIGDRVDARAFELGARIDELTGRVAPTVAGSTQSERSTVLPYVLTALGNVPPGSTILVTDTPGGVVPVVLAALGYDIVTAPPPDGGPRVVAAVVRGASVSDAGVEEAARVMKDEGLMVLITQEFDRPRLEQLLDGWRIDDPTNGRQELESGPGVILTRAVLAPNQR